MSKVFENMMSEVTVRVIKVSEPKKNKPATVLRASSGMESEAERYQRVLRMMWTTTLALS